MGETFIFIEDRDPETGHGWRDEPYTLEISNPDGPIKVTTVDSRSRGKFAEYSYAWICPEEYYLKHKHLKDNIRGSHAKESYPGFLGVNDMESHFEFHMCPSDMKKHLLSLGMREIKK